MSFEGRDVNLSIVPFSNGQEVFPNRHVESPQVQQTQPQQNSSLQLTTLTLHPNQPALYFQDKGLFGVYVCEGPDGNLVIGTNIPPKIMRTFIIGSVITVLLSLGFAYVKFSSGSLKFTIKLEKNKKGTCNVIIYYYSR